MHAEKQTTTGLPGIAQKGAGATLVFVCVSTHSSFSARYVNCRSNCVPLWQLSNMNTSSESSRPARARRARATQKDPLLADAYHFAPTHLHARLVE